MHIFIILSFNSVRRSSCSLLSVDTQLGRQNRQTKSEPEGNSQTNMAEFDVETVSCSSKITAKIRLNIDSLLSEYGDEDNLNFVKWFEIDSGNGSNYKGIIWIYDRKKPTALHLAVGGKTTKPFSKGLSILMADVQKLDYEMKIVFSETISKKFKGGIIGIPTIIPTIPKNNNTRFACEDFITLDKVISGKIKSIKADITLDFEPSPQLICKQKFLNYVNTCLVFNVFKEDGTVAKKDFKIVCRGGEQFGFNRSILCKISPVFERMLANTSLKEHKNGRVEINDTTPKTIKAFSNILSLNYIQTEELTFEMLLFADKYEIHPLYNLCQDHLCTAITKENVFDVIKAANYTKDEKLIGKSAEFMRANLGAFDMEENPEWTKFCKENPECGNKILNLMIFTKK